MSLFFCDIDGLGNVAEINPATGLPMIDGFGNVDVRGNPYGIDWSSHLSLESGSPFDQFSGGSSGIGGIDGGGFSLD